jgi:predicted DNA-binding transcriptional regulator YafY
MDSSDHGICSGGIGHYRCHDPYDGKEVDMHKVERQLAVVDTLRQVAPATLTSAELADELGFSVRTIERDLAELQSRGLSVSGNRGRRGGYQYTEHGPLVIIALPRKEAEALLNFVYNYRDARLNRTVRQCISTIRKAL